MTEPQIGDRLLTKDGRKYGNGIIIGLAMIHDDPIVSYQIESDFGNVFFKRADEIDTFWWVDNSEDNSAERWHSDREELRSRSSMMERPPVQREDAGLVPAVTATILSWLTDKVPEGLYFHETLGPEVCLKVIHPKNF